MYKKTSVDLQSDEVFHLDLAGVIHYKLIATHATLAIVLCLAKRYFNIAHMDCLRWFRSLSADGMCAVEAVRQLVCVTVRRKQLSSISQSDLAKNEGCNLVRKIGPAIRS